MTIQQLAEKYRRNHTDILSQYNEMQLRNEYLDSFFEILGWDIKNISGKSTNEREVILEESLKEEAETNAKKPDYTFRLFSERKFFVEAKKPNIPIESNPEFAKQVRRYGFTAKLKISILSNFEYLLIYDCSVPVEEKDSHHKALIKQYHYTEYVEKIDEIKALLGKDSVYSGQFDIQWKDIEDNLKLFSVDQLFLKQINRWRLMLGEEILKYEPSLEENNLNDIVQSYLNRIIFLRVCEDRNLELYKTLLSFANVSDFRALINKFEEADKKYNSGLFEQELSDKIIRDISSVFWIIIRELYFPECPYSFSVFASDILGSIYEIFLSEKLTILNGTLSLIKKPENVDKDIITTPVFVIKDILRQTILSACSSKTDQEILSLSICDIACGSGAFLLEAYQLVSDILIDFYLKNNPSMLIQTSISSYKLLFEIKKELLLKCIFGIDKDYNAVEATKFGLLLKLLENESNTSLENNNPILPSLDDNIKWGNSLINSDNLEDVSEEIIEKINPYDFDDQRFDFIIGNPPYMKSEDMKNITAYELPIYKEKYESAYKQFDKYFLFIERAIGLLKENGRLGFIVPSKFTKVGAGKKLRHLLTANGYIERIVSFGANQIFDSKTTYTCLLILKKSLSDTCEYLEVKNLTSWKVRNIADDDYEKIHTNNLEADVWILVPTELKSAFNKIYAQSISLEKLVEDKENISNGIQTSANDIYIIQPLEKDAKYLYFEKDGKKWKIEKELTRPYFHTASGIDNLYTYRLFKPNSIVIYPYKKIKNKIVFVKNSELKSKYPNLKKYLNHYKIKLADPKRDIKPKPETRNEWYRYGRHQALDRCDVPEKIVVGILSQGNKYAIDRYHTLISSGGTAGYCMIVLPDHSPYSIYYIQALLNSKYVEWYSALIGEVFRGGYIARGTKVLKRLPIRKIDFSNKKDKSLHNEIAAKQKRLIKIQSQLDKAVKNPRVRKTAERAFKKELRAMEHLLLKLYNLGDDDKKIPLIKEMYAAD